MSDPAPAAPAMAKAPQAPLLVRLVIVVFALAYISYSLYFVVDTWVHRGRLLRCLLGIEAEAPLSPLFIACVHAVVGSVLGAGVLDLVSFHKYVAVERNFERAHVWGYFLGPWLAAVLGLVVFALLQSGLLILSGGPGDSSNAEIRNLGFLGIGFLSGFGWRDVTQRLQQLVRRFFSELLGDREPTKGREGGTSREEAEAHPPAASERGAEHATEDTPANEPRVQTLPNKVLQPARPRLAVSWRRAIWRRSVVPRTALSGRWAAQLSAEPLCDSEELGIRSGKKIFGLRLCPTSSQVHERREWGTFSTDSLGDLGGDGERATSQS